MSATQLDAAAASSADPFPRTCVAARRRALALAAYVVYACAQLDVSWERVADGPRERARGSSARMFPPNFARWELLVKGLAESLQIAVLASALGIAARAADRARRRAQPDAGVGDAGRRAR